MHSPAVVDTVCIGLRRQKLRDNYKKVPKGKLLIVLPQVNMESLKFLSGLVTSWHTQATLIMAVSALNKTKLMNVSCIHYPWKDLI